MPPKKRAKLTPSAHGTPHPSTPSATSPPPSTTSAQPTAASPAIPTPTGASIHLTDASTPSDAWTTSQQTLLFKALIKHKPTGLHKHMHMLSIASSIASQYHATTLQHPSSGPQFQHMQLPSHLRIPGIWSKLQTLYDLDELDQREKNFALQQQAEYLTGGAEDEEEIAEFALPQDDAYFADEMWVRRFPAEGDGSESNSPTLMPGLLSGHDRETKETKTKKGRGRRKSEAEDDAEEENEDGVEASEEAEDDENVKVEEEADGEEEEKQQPSRSTRRTTKAAVTKSESKDEAEDGVATRRSGRRR